MHRLPPSSRMPSRARRRSGFSTRGLILALALVLAVPLLAWAVLRNGGWASGDEDGPMMYQVKRGQFIHDVSERGSVESASNVEIVSKVRSSRSGGSGSGGVAILWIIPEGTQVEPGDEVCRLDSSALELQKDQQEIVKHNSQAAVIQAENLRDAADIAKKEYLKGTYQASELEADNAIEEATEARDRLQAYWEFSKSMHEKGYHTKLQLQADYSALLQAQNKLDLALLKRKVLEQYEKEKLVLQLNADIAIAEAKLDAARASHSLEVKQLNDIEEQIKNCTLHTEQAGQVVYANREGHRGSGDIVIEEGTLVREGQAIIRLPDPKRMQVKAKVNEARVKLVKKGMPAGIRLDAFPDVELQGVVEEVKEYPAPTWYGWNVKEYETFIKILDSEGLGLRPGYTAEVKIRVEVLDDVLQVPVQAIIEHGEKHYCVLRDGKRLRARQVTIGSTNDKFVVIQSGLKKGEQVVHNAAVYREEVGLPELPPEAMVQRGRSERDGRSETGEADDAQEPSPQRAGPPNRAQMLQRLDSNGDGQLDKDELAQVPEQFRPRLMAADENGDGTVDRSELAAAMAQEAPGGRPGGPQADGRPGRPRAGNRPGGRRPGASP